MEKLRMTNAYTVDKPRRWRVLRDFIIMGSLSVGLVFGTHYAIKYEKEIKQYVNTKVEDIEKKAKEYLNDFF